MSRPAEATATLARAAEDFDFDGTGAPSRWMTLVASTYEDDLDVQSVYAGWLTNLSPRLSELGSLEEAIAAAKKSAGIYRRLAVEDGRLQFLSSLAGSLHLRLEQLHRLAAQGGASEAQEFIEPTHEAVEVARRVAKKWPERGFPALASSLDAAVATLVVFSRREEAVEFAQESADIYGNLVDQRRNEFLPDLAKSLTRVGKLLKGDEATRGGATAVTASGRNKTSVSFRAPRSSTRPCGVFSGSNGLLTRHWQSRRGA